MFSSDELVIDQCIIIEIVAILKENEECILYREGKGIFVSKLFDFVNFNGCKNLRKLSDGLGIYLIEIVI